MSAILQSSPSAAVQNAYNHKIEEAINEEDDDEELKQEVQHGDFRDLHEKSYVAKANAPSSINLKIDTQMLKNSGKDIKVTFEVVKN